MSRITCALLVAVAAQSYAGERYYADFSVGRSDQESSVPWYSASGKSTSLGVRGGYTFNEYVAFELGYVDYGEMRETQMDGSVRITDKISTKTVNAGIKLSLPLSSQWAVVGRLGMARWMIRLVESTSQSLKARFRDDGKDPYYGIGLEYQVKHNLTVGLGYTSLEFEHDVDGTTVDHELENLALSVGYRF